MAVNLKFTQYLSIVCFCVCANLAHAQFINIDSSIAVLKTMKDDTNKVKLLNNIAWDISYQSLKKGIEYSDKSLDLAKKLKFERYYPQIYNTQGAVYDDMAESGKALECLLEGIKYAKKYGFSNQLVILNNSIGNLYSKREEYHKALSYYKLSADISKKNKTGSSYYLVYGNIASIYVTFKKLDSAIYYLNVCLPYHIRTNNKPRLLNNYLLLSEIKYEQNDAVSSINAVKKAIEIGESLGDTYTLSHAYLQLGLANSLNNDYKGGINALNKSVELATKTGDVPVYEKASSYLSEFYEKLGDYKNSLVWYKKYGEYKDSSLNKESITQVRNAEAKFENEKKQKEIELLAEKQKLNETENQKKKIYLYAALLGIMILGGGLIMLFKNNKLKHKINKDLESFNSEINHQKNLLETKNIEITDSINYAKRIQDNILTSELYFKNHTNDYFILFKPKDIVSGDFYWALNHDDKFIVMTADCTGHGVPGAMMSMMGINFLNEIVNEKEISQPSKILNQLRKDIIKALNPEGSIVETKDGMDCCLCSFDFKSMTLTYSNANNAFYVIRNNELITSKVNKMPVGAGYDIEKQFEEENFEIKKGDLIVTLTDGYADQFGGPKGKKFKYKLLEELLLNNAHLPLSQIKQKLNDTIVNWKGDYEQVDDICLIGIRV